MEPEPQPTPRYQPSDAEQQALDEVNHCIEEARRWHTSFARKVERRYDAWRGMAPENAPKSWRSQLHPPYLINIVEGMLSSMEETEPTWQVTPCVVPGMSLEEAVAMSDRAEINEHLLTHQMRVDEFASKQGPWMHQDLVAGFTPGKVSWLKRTTDRKYLDEKPEMIFDDAGGSIDIANKLDAYVERDFVLRDDPTFEGRDVRDFLYPESAVSVDTAPWILDRTFVHFKTLVRLEKLGVYSNVEYVKETRHDSTSRGPDVVADREMRLRNVDRTRGLVEIIELWSDNRVITVANRSVVLRDVPNPFWHGRKPFVICSAIPDMFQIPGVSVIEGLAQMQEMLWTLTNLRLDTTRMAANLITLIRGDVDNADDFEWAPNAQWVVADPKQVSTLPIDPTIATISLQAESLLKGDIQNVMGGLPYTGGADSQTVDTKTATGISIVNSIAQAVLARRKQMYMRSFAQIGSMFLGLDQQFLREERLVEIIGAGGARRYVEINPLQTQGYFNVNVKMMGDSMMRQERRAEAQALLTMAMQFAAPQAQLGTRPLNLDKFWEKVLDAYDEPEKMAFFKDPPPPPAAAAAPPPGPPGGDNGTPPGADTLMADMAGGNAAPGVTNETLAAGTTSPSSAVSISPVAAQQRTGAMVGSGRSV